MKILRTIHLLASLFILLIRLDKYFSFKNVPSLPHFKSHTHVLYCTSKITKIVLLLLGLHAMGRHISLFDLFSFQDLIFIFFYFHYLFIGKAELLICILLLLTLYDTLSMMIVISLMPSHLMDALSLLID